MKVVKSIISNLFTSTVPHKEKIMSINLNALRDQLKKEVNVYAIARKEYRLKVNEKVETKEDVIERIVSEEYRLAFV
jgi:broad specificity polyphosphatase/5'/3'-nucleotidase SurE